MKRNIVWCDEKIYFSAIKEQQQQPHLATTKNATARFLSLCCCCCFPSASVQLLYFSEFRNLSPIYSIKFYRNKTITFFFCAKKTLSSLREHWILGLNSQNKWKFIVRYQELHRFFVVFKKRFIFPRAIGSHAKDNDWFFFSLSLVFKPIVV